jgi:cytochrome c oxidase assembly protein Cox11
VNNRSNIDITMEVDPKSLEEVEFSTLSQQNAVVLRPGEILLMYAEAQNELAGPDASVYKAVTDLRARVGMPHYK